MNKKNRSLTLMALYIAIAIALDFIKETIGFLDMPSGGSINIALLPIVISSFHLGAKKGLLIGFIWWLISFMFGLNQWFISVPQYILDYIVPSVIIGASSIFYKNKKIIEVELGIVFTMIIRTISIVISGAIYWPGDLASGSLPAWIYSLSYNLPYCMATLVMLMIIVPILLRSLKKYLL